MNKEVTSLTLGELDNQSLSALEHILQCIIHEDINQADLLI